MEYLTDFLSTYRACINLARDKAFLSRFTLHFKIDATNKPENISNAVRSLLQTRYLRNKETPVEELHKWSQSVKRSDFTGIARITSSFKQRIGGKWILVKNQVLALHFLDLQNDVEQYCQLFKEGVSPELRQLLSSVNMDKLSESSTLKETDGPITLRLITDLAQ